jgi:hydroxypyruvate isomerase
MLRFSANLSMLFGEYDFLARFEKAAQCGFRGVEFMFPYDYDIEELKQVLASNKLEHTLHNLPAGDWAAGERGIACIPGREEEFRDGVAAAIRYARALGNKKINCLVGNTQNRNGISRSGIERGDHVRARRTGSPQTYADIPCRCAGITFRHVRSTFHMTRQNVTNTAVLTHR